MGVGHISANLNRIEAHLEAEQGNRIPMLLMSGCMN
jgi:hypothetical protein